MKKIHNNIIEPDHAVLVGVGIGKNIAESDLDELSALCETCNIKEAGRIVQNRKDVDVTYYVGKGKVYEINELVKSAGANVVVFDIELSGAKVRNLEEVLGVPVLDRSKVILDIFAQRAQSIEGKLQVELAQLKYNLPRLVGSGGKSMAQMKSAVGMRGPGEKKLELDKRTIRDRILALEDKLKKINANREINKKNAKQSGRTRVCIVGYTNSGKSTLLNTIAKTGVMTEDKLFATLDPKTAKVYLGREQDGEERSWQKGTQILLTDTVGFIDKLPHEFIKAFESTLDEARYADLLLHVVDVSGSKYQEQIAVVNSVLAKIGAGDVPTILLLNKIDLLDQQQPCEIAEIFKGQNYVTVSALKNMNIDILKEKVFEFVSERKK